MYSCHFVTIGTLYYWPIKARGYGIAAIAKEAGIDIKWEANFDLAALKAAGTLPFGQLPYLEHNGVKIAQSGAIMRYLAKVGNLNGETIEDFALSEMLIEESQDIFAAMAKCMYSPDKVAAFNEFFAAGGGFANHLGHLERMHPGGSPYFKAGEKRLAGGVALAAVLDMAVALQADCLDAFPKMKAFYEAFIARPCFDGIREHGMYLNRA